MNGLKITALACLGLVAAATSSRSGASPPSESFAATTAAPAALCKEAIVNPVSGYAECVQPPGAPVDPAPRRPSLVKLAVFDFELDDISPAAALLGQTTSDAAIMKKVSSEARRMLASSGRFDLIDVNSDTAEPAVRTNSLRKCNGCEAGIALRAGADQALIGVVRRVTQTDYYVVIQISDAVTGKVLNEQEANFAGGPDGWASGVRMLIKHQILGPVEEP
jgi:Protein of unknown function (DUF2380)